MNEKTDPRHQEKTQGYIYGNNTQASISWSEGDVPGDVRQDGPDRLRLHLQAQGPGGLSEEGALSPGQALPGRGQPRQLVPGVAVHI